MSTLLERYRPKTFEEVIEQEEVLECLKGYIETGSVPNIIFTGPSGSGKTLLSRLFIESLLGDKRNDLVLYTNASEDRGIKVVRNLIKKFATFSLDPSEVKIVFLDEADSLTLDSQYALRRIMEDFSKSTRFILTCNYLNRIIEPLVSRCTQINLRCISLSGVKDLFQRIAIKENLEKADLECLYVKHHGNIRKILHEIEVSFDKQRDSVDWNKFIECPIEEVPAHISQLFRSGGKFNEAVQTLVNQVVSNESVETKVNFLKEVSTVLVNIGNKGNPEINLTYLVLFYRKLISST